MRFDDQDVIQGNTLLGEGMPGAMLSVSKSVEPLASQHRQAMDNPFARPSHGHQFPGRLGMKSGWQI